MDARVASRWSRSTLEPRFLDEPCVETPRQDALMVDFPAGSFDLIARQAWR
jgi:hypothetical protein